jgi:thiamine-monophosphate kinase
MNEVELIARLLPSLARGAGVLTGPGDDCAVLDVGIPGKRLLFKTDAVVEGIHFEKGTAGERVGHKALARCLSDVAAMAGTPTHAVVTLALPERFDPEYVDAIYSGLNRLANRYDVGIVGGETTANPERLLISVALIGTVAPERLVLRSGAASGDALFVTGELGGSMEGKHLDFEPRLREAQWLAHHAPIRAMIDLSDGLASDLRHLLGQSGCGAELLTSAVPLSPAARRNTARESARKPPLLAALTDGEDFELLFAVPARDAVRVLDGWKKVFPEVRLSCIGKVTAQPGIFLRDKDGTRPFTAHGYVHFSKPG